MSNGRKPDTWKLARCLHGACVSLLSQRSVRRKTLVGLVSQQIEDEDCKPWISEAITAALPGVACLLLSILC